MDGHELPSPTVPGPLLDWLLCALAPMNRTRVKQLLRSGRISVNGRSITRHDHPVVCGDRIVVSRTPIMAPSVVGISVVYQDDALVVIDKPAGLLSVATDSEKLDTAFVRVRSYLEPRHAGRPFVVHRLDRETSGLLLFARSAEIRDRLQANWEAVTKSYLAVVEGTPDPAAGTVDNFLAEGRDLRVRASDRPVKHAKRAITHYRVVRSGGSFSLVQLELGTGRKHQIRVHLAGLGCPVVGDRLYGSGTDPAGRLGLHSWRMKFEHPICGKSMEIEAPFPERLRTILPLESHGERAIEIE